MRMRHYCRLFFFLIPALLQFLPTYAHSADYYWRTAGQSQSDAASPAASCAAWASWYTANPANTSSATCSGSTYYSSNSFRSCFSYKNKTTGQNSGSDCKYSTRYGDSCPSGTTYDSATGECKSSDPNNCAAKNGQSFPFNKSGQSGDGYGVTSGGYFVAAQSGCYGGCAANTADQKCTAKVSGSYSCRGTGYYTGQACGASPEVGDSTSSEDPQPQTYTENKPCNYTTDSSGAQVCTSEKKEEKEGQYCGEVNGVKKCVDAKPTNNGVIVDTKVTTTTNSNGTTTTTKTDTATTSKCTGIGQCTSSTTTTTTTIIKDGNGNTTSTSGSCTGANCPDSNTNPDGDGDGFGDCVDGNCGEGEGEGESIGAQDWYEPVEDTYGSVIQAFVNRLSDAPVISGIDNFLALNPGGSCPIWTIDVWVFHAVLDQWCSNAINWAFIKAIVLAVAAMMAFRIAFL